MECKLLRPSLTNIRLNENNSIRSLFYTNANQQPGSESGLACS